MFESILQRACYGWRLFATGLCFALFGLGGVVLLVLIFPLLRILIWNKERQTRYAKSVVNLAFRFFVGLMRAVGIYQYEIIGQHRLNRRGLLILANHPTLIDTVFLMAFVQHADCIVKADLQSNLFTRGAVNAAGYVCNSVGNSERNEFQHGFMSDCIKSLQHGNNLIVFPEGTRTPAHGQINLKRGAANIALRAKCNVTPVLITCQPMILGKHQKWWHIPRATVKVRIEVQEDIKIDQFINQSTSEAMNEAIAARHLTTHLQTYFSERIQPHA